VSLPKPLIALSSLLCLILHPCLDSRARPCRERRRKDDAVFEALGDVDELTVAIGVAREYCSLNDEPCHKLLVGRLTEIQ